MFHKILFKLPKPLSLKEGRKKLSHAIGGECYTKKLNVKLSPQKKKKTKQKITRKEG